MSGARKEALEAEQGLLRFMGAVANAAHGTRKELWKAYIFRVVRPLLSTRSSSQLTTLLSAFASSRCPDAKPVLPHPVTLTLCKLGTAVSARDVQPGESRRVRAPRGQVTEPRHPSPDLTAGWL